ncbi:MAG: hypothetical protein V4582_14120 [Pseudomonadota bacterium]
MKKTVFGAALLAASIAPLSAQGADDKELAEIRAQIAAMKQDYEARLQQLEQRLQQAQAAANVTPPVSVAPIAPAAPAASNAFNPNISLVLGGTLANLSQDPAQYRLQGFLPAGGEAGPGKRGFNLGESELTFAANVDPTFNGQLTFSLSGEDSVGVEEAFVQSGALANGANLRLGRFLSSIGYLNSQHAHAWDFVDAPLAYQAFFGGQYKPDGVQFKWLAPSDSFIELGAELGSGAAFPGSARGKNGVGSAAVFAHMGDDVGTSGSWRAGLSYLHTGSQQRAFDNGGQVDAFSGDSSIWMADAIYKWAPNGNATRENFKLQAEYLHRRESGTLSHDAASSQFASTQAGWYLQGVYQFTPAWRAGARYERLDSGNASFGLAGGAALYPGLAPYAPARASLMLDYSPSEFSRFRLQWARDQSRPDAIDNQLFLQYIMSLGTHAAHAF